MTVKMLGGYTQLLPHLRHCGGGRPPHRDSGKDKNSPNRPIKRDHGIAFDLNVIEIDLHRVPPALLLPKFNSKPV